MCNTVFDLCFADILDLCRILHRLEQNLRIRTLRLLHILWNVAVERIIQFRRIDQYRLFFAKRPR